MKKKIMKLVSPTTHTMIITIAIPHYAVLLIRPDTNQISGRYSEVKHQLKILQLPVNVRCFTVSYTAT